jgi:hypothetical protein
MLDLVARWILILLPLGALAGVLSPARGDLIRPRNSPTYPDIAGDLVGSQTYTFDPSSRTGTFQVVNSPQFIALGPSGNDLFRVTPNTDGTLTQKLELKLDQNGRLVETPDNTFQLYGTIKLGDQEYQGLLLEGKPTAFGVQGQSNASLNQSVVFDLNMTITGGQLKDAFGPDAYFRVIPQSNSTFQGSFASSFSGGKPMTNLRALQGNLPSPIPEPSSLFVFVFGGGGFLMARVLRSRRQQKRALKGPEGIPPPASSRLS